MNSYQNPFYPEPSFSLKDRLRNFIRDNSVLNRLIVINIAVFILYFVVNLIFKTVDFLAGNNGSAFSITVLQWLACPASFSAAILRPWTYVTSLFLHISFWHIFFNVLMLFIAGKIFLNNLTDKQLLITYLIGGVVGNIFYQCSYHIFPVFSAAVGISHVLGASGSIMAVFAAAVLCRPNERLRLLLLGDIKIIWLFVIFVVIDLLSITKGNAGGHIAHLGGAAYGAVYIFFQSKKWKFLHFPKRNNTKKKKKEKFYTSQPFNNFTDEEYNAQKRENERKTDEILDKISKYGYDALTKEEKDFLFYESRRKQ
ncbi:MAG: rhomboid family intramembrane serine protease [Bacteroidales bacterium]|nr:rhomboid family intramembrane serine protease [Bacteroidales bacterium]